MTDIDVEELDEVSEFAHPYIDAVVTFGAWKYIVDNNNGGAVGTYAEKTWVTPPVAPPLIATLVTTTAPIGVTGTININLDPTTLVSATAKVKFNGVIHANSTVTNGGAKIAATSITMPATPGQYPIQVVDGERLSNIMMFAVTAPAPTNSSIAPTSAIYGAQLRPTLTGSNYFPGCKMMVSGPGGVTEEATTLTGNTIIQPVNLLTVPSSGFEWNFWAKNVDGQESSATFKTISIGASAEELAARPDLKTATIAMIQQWVDAFPDIADEALVYEQEHQNRVTLVDWLQGFISHRDEGTIP